MTGSELIQRLASKNKDLGINDIETVVRHLLRAIGDHLAKDGRVEIRGFGSFQNHITPPKNGRNPKTGAPVKVPAKCRPHFKSGKELRDRVNRQG